LSLLAFLVLLGIVGPDLTGQYSWVESIREVVIAVDLVPNILLGVAIGLASFFLVSSISIISPKMTKGA
jgi:hypothetical protein